MDDGTEYLPIPAANDPTLVQIIIVIIYFIITATIINIIVYSLVYPSQYIFFLFFLLNMGFYLLNMGFFRLILLYNIALVLPYIDLNPP